MSTHLTATMTPPTIPADMATAALRGESARLAILRLVATLNDLDLSPSYWDVARSLNVSHPSVQYHVRRLRADGYLEPSGPLKITAAGLDLIS